MLEGRTGEAASRGGIRIWAGRIADSFYIDLSLLAIINGAVANGTALDLSGWRPDNAQNSFADTHRRLDRAGGLRTGIRMLRPGARIGVWCATKLATDAGGWRQVNRAGHPMMWPIFWPNDTDFTDPANTRHPSEDFAPTASTWPARSPPSWRPPGPSGDPHGLRPDSGPELFPDVLPYVVGTPATYGFAGSQRPDAGRQRARGDAVAGRQHGRAVRAQAVRRRAAARQQLPLRRPCLTLRANESLLLHAIIA